MYFSIRTYWRTSIDKNACPLTSWVYSCQPLFPSKPPLPISSVVKCRVGRSLMHEDRVVTNASSVLTAPLATLTTVPASGRRREWPAGPKSSNYRLCHFLPPSWVLASDTHSALCPQQGCKQSHPTVGAGPTWLSALLHSDHGGVAAACGTASCPAAPCTALQKGLWRCLPGRDRVSLLMGEMLPHSALSASQRAHCWVILWSRDGSYWPTPEMICHLLTRS